MSDSESGTAKRKNSRKPLGARAAAGVGSAAPQVASQQVTPQAPAAPPAPTQPKAAARPKPSNDIPIPDPEGQAINIPEPGDVVGIFAKPANLARDPRENRDATVLWPRVLKGVRDRGFDPALIRIDIDRVGLGQDPHDAIRCTWISGESVCGSDPGGELMHRIVETVHRGSISSARYYCMFRFKTGGDITKGELTLPPYDQLVAQRRQSEALDAQRRDYRPAMNPGPPTGYPGAPGFGGIPDLGGYSPGFPRAGDSGVEDLRREFARMSAIYETRDQIMREQLEKAGVGAVAMPPPPPVAAGPAVDPFDQFLSQIERLETLKKRLGLGQPPAERAQAQAMPAAQTQAPAHQTQAAPAAPDPFAFLKTLEEAEKMKKRFASALGIDLEALEEEKPEVPTEIVVEGAKEPFKTYDIPGIIAGKSVKYVYGAESLGEWAKAMFSLNPDLAGKVLEVGTKVLEKSVFGRLAETIIAGPGGGQSMQAPPPSYAPPRTVAAPPPRPSAPAPPPPPAPPATEEVVAEPPKPNGWHPTA
jgi:hypothetical protein